MHSLPEGAVVSDSSGAPLGVTPFAVRGRHRSPIVSVSAPGYSPASVRFQRRLKPITYLNLINPFGWLIDLGSGAAWSYRPRSVSVTLAPVPEADPPEPERPSDVVASEVHRQLAGLMRELGCPEVLAESQEFAARLLRSPTDPPLPAETVMLVAREVEDVRAEMGQVCQTSGAALEELRALNDPNPFRDLPVASDSTALAPVFFDFGQWRIKEDSVVGRLRRIGARLAAEGEPIVVVIEGLTDPAGSEALNRELGYQRAMSVAREMERGGLSRSGYRIESAGEEPHRRIYPSAWGRRPEARWNRRVIMFIDFTVSRP